MAPDHPDEARAGPAEHHELVPRHSNRRIQRRRLCDPSERVRGAEAELREGVCKVLGEAQSGCLKKGGGGGGCRRDSAESLS